MSDQAPEGGGRRRENAFTRRIGPLPMWQWLLIALAMLGVYVIYSYRKKNQAAASAGNQAGGTATGGTTGAGQIPQFVNQTYVQGAPPSAPQPPPSMRVPSPRPATTINLASWKAGAPESQQAWNADLNNIAAHYGISLSVLEAANPQLPDPNKIAPGTVINIPAR